MTAQIIRPNFRNPRSSTPSIHPAAKEALNDLEMISRSVGVDVRTASGADLDLLTEAVWEHLARRNLGLLDQHRND